MRSHISIFFFIYVSLDSTISPTAVIIIAVLMVTFVNYISLFARREYQRQSLLWLWWDCAFTMLCCSASIPYYAISMETIWLYLAQTVIYIFSRGKTTREHLKGRGKCTCSCSRNPLLWQFCLDFVYNFYSTRPIILLKPKAWRLARFRLPTAPQIPQSRTIVWGNIVWGLVSCSYTLPWFLHYQKKKKKKKKKKKSFPYMTPKILCKPLVLTLSLNL